jgi:hypothetical protein
MINYIFLLLGSLVLFALRLNKAWVKKDFSWKYFFKRNVIHAFVILAFGIVVIYNSESAEYYIGKILPWLSFKVTAFTSFALGMIGDVLLRYVIELFDPRKKTKIGVNADGNQ